MRPIASPSAGLRSHHGFTLIELIVAIAVLAIMVTWAVPSFQQFTARNEVAAEVMRLKSALAVARSSAVARGITVTVCPSTDQDTCTNDNWSGRLVVVAGRASGGDISGEEVLRVLESRGGTAITYRKDSRPVRYSAQGWSRGHNGTFRICGNAGTGARVIVSNTGRTRVVREPDCGS